MTFYPVKCFPQNMRRSDSRSSMTLPGWMSCQRLEFSKTWPLPGCIHSNAFYSPNTWDSMQAFIRSDFNFDAYIVSWFCFVSRQPRHDSGDDYWELFPVNLITFLFLSHALSPQQSVAVNIAVHDCLTYRPQVFDEYSNHAFMLTSYSGISVQISPSLGKCTTG